MNGFNHDPKINPSSLLCKLLFINPRNDGVEKI